MSEKQKSVFERLSVKEASRPLVEHQILEESYHEKLWRELRKPLPTSHGGVNSCGKRKTRRPLAPGQWIHLVVKSEKAKGQYSFLTTKNKTFIQRLIKEKAFRFGVKIGDFVNMGNHLHLKVKFSSRINFQNFLRVLTAMISRYITGAKRGVKFGRFWQGLAFTRVLKSSFEQLQLKGYFEANRQQRDIGDEARHSYLLSFNKWIYQLRYQQKQWTS